LILVGGSALALLGSPRLTLDIDFIGDDVHPIELHRTIMQVARDLKIHVEPVPIEQFVPLPKGSEQRAIHIGQFGNLEIHVADPYSIALSKLDRGFDTGLEDIVFLIHSDHVTLEELENITDSTAKRSLNREAHEDRQEKANPRILFQDNLHERLIFITRS
jgi:hypothetical protein